MRQIGAFRAPSFEVLLDREFVSDSREGHPHVSPYEIADRQVRFFDDPLPSSSQCTKLDTKSVDACASTSQVVSCKCPVTIKHPIETSISFGFSQQKMSPPPSLRSVPNSSPVSQPMGHLAMINPRGKPSVRKNMPKAKRAPCTLSFKYGARHAPSRQMRELGVASLATGSSRALLF